MRYLHWIQRRKAVPDGGGQGPVGHDILERSSPSMDASLHSRPLDLPSNAGGTTATQQADLWRLCSFQSADQKDFRRNRSCAKGRKRTLRTKAVQTGGQIR